jgi:hypothetical protein
MDKKKSDPFSDRGYPWWVVFYNSALDLPIRWQESPRRIREFDKPERREDEKVCSNCRKPKKAHEFATLITGALNSWCIQCKTEIEQTRRKRPKNVYRGI